MRAQTLETLARGDGQQRTTRHEGHSARSSLTYPRDAGPRSGRSEISRCEQRRTGSRSYELTGGSMLGGSAEACGHRPIRSSRAAPPHRECLGGGPSAAPRFIAASRMFGESWHINPPLSPFASCGPRGCRARVRSAIDATRRPQPCAQAKAATSVIARRSTSEPSSARWSAAARSSSSSTAARSDAVSEASRRRT